MSEENPYKAPDIKKRCSKEHLFFAYGYHLQHSQRIQQQRPQEDRG